MIKTGTVEKSKEVLCQDCYTLDRIAARFDRMQINLVTVVNKERGLGEFQKVLSQRKRQEKFSRYPQSLLQSMFKHW
ncbi:hypothetical protein [Bacillus sp. REN10]|uniref:hypothetical protein n=1 Tax=Bacillus sp. REN10 TaxID=2782541 RepID=UPI00193AF349|nr:hypothetical protein [Bacillus sp. REN10]